MPILSDPEIAIVDGLAGVSTHLLMYALRQRGLNIFDAHGCPMQGSTLDCLTPNQLSYELSRRGEVAAEAVDEMGRNAWPSVEVLRLFHLGQLEAECRRRRNVPPSPGTEV